MVRILFTRFPLESTKGGAENQTLAVMKGLGQRGHAIAFLGSCPVMLAMCREEGIPAAELSIGPPPVTMRASLRFFWSGKAMQRKLTGALAQFSGLDAVVMLSLSEKILLTEPAVACGIRVFWLEHDRVGRWLRQNPWLGDLRRLSAKATTIVVSELSKKIYGELGFARARIVAIPNGINLDRWQPRPPHSPRATANESLRVGCVARLSPEKGLDVLIDAVKDIPDVTLEIVGTGREEEALRRRSGGNPSITFTRNVEDLAAFYRSLDALVLPSRDHDPFGLAAAEAMACGVPVIVTDACGIAGSLRDGEDVLIAEAGSVGALRDAISSLRDPQRRTDFGERGARMCRDAFPVERMVKRYEDVLAG